MGGPHCWDSGTDDLVAPVLPSYGCVHQFLLGETRLTHWWWIVWVGVGVSREGQVVEVASVVVGSVGVGWVVEIAGPPDETLVWNWVVWVERGTGLMV